MTDTVQLIGARQTSFTSVPRIWRSDIYRTKLEDITPSRATSATAEYNDDYDTKRRATVTVRNPDALRDLQDWFILETTVTDQRGVQVTYPLGHYLVTGRDVRHDNHGRQGTITGEDITWLLSQATVNVNYTVPVGTDTGAAARQIILERGVPAALVDIPDSGVLTTNEVTGQHGDRWWKLVTDLLAGGAMYQPFVGMDYRIRSMKVVDITTAQPTVSYRQGEGAKIVPPVQNRPDLTRLRNRVTVRKVTPGEPTIQYTADVIDDGSRLHPTNLAALLGSSTPVILGVTYDESAIATEAEAQQLAEYRLSLAGSFLDRLNIVTYIDSALDAHQIIDVNLTDGFENHHTGNWLQRTFRVTLGGAAATVSRELTRSVDWR